MSRHYELASAFDRDGDEPAAIPEYRAAIAEGLDAVDLPHAYLGLGSSLRLVGETAESIAVLEDAVSLFPAHAPLRVFLALSLWEEGRRADAARQLVEAVVCAPESSADVAAFGEPMLRYAREL